MSRSRSVLASCSPSCTSFWIELGGRACVTPPLILAVDDTPQNLDLLRRRLSSQGYEVTTAEDGEAALERTAELLPDLILLDIMMPRLDGIETVRRLKANPAHQHIPVILVTAKSDPMDVIEGLDAGG